MNFKISMAGDGVVGKTTIITRFVKDKFIEDYIASIGVEIFSKLLIVENKEVQLQIWDCAGQTSFKAFRTKFFAKTQGVLLVFDLTTPRSLYSLHSWIAEVKKIAGEIPLVLIGNKADLKETHSVSGEEIREFLRKQPSISVYYQASALTGKNIEKAFQELVSQILKRNGK